MNSNVTTIIITLILCQLYNLSEVQLSLYRVRAYNWEIKKVNRCIFVPLKTNLIIFIVRKILNVHPF